MPLFLLCNCRPDERTVDVWFNSDFFPVFFMAVFSFTNGYFASLAMMYGPGMVESGPEATAAGAFMGATLGVGLLTGAFMSFAISAVL